MEVTVRHNRKTYEFLRNTKARTNILFGSAGSGKSWSIAQYLLFEKMYKEKNIRILVTQKTRPALKKAAWLVMNDLLQLYKLPDYTINLSDLIIRANGNEMYFTSIDDPEKLKSFEKINYIWGEEATNLTKKDYMQLKLRCRGANPNGSNKLFFSFNPVDEMSFWKPLTENPLEDMAVNHSVYQDNAFLDPAYRAELERFAEEDITYHKIYALGLWATPENIIYKRWDVVDGPPERYDDIYWGLDFGYSINEAALIQIYVRGDEVWERERIYECGLTNPDLINKLGEIIENRNQMIIADCAEPKSIQEIRNAGFNIHPCLKGKDSVCYGINAVKSVFTHLCKDSSSLIKEKRSYKWKEDKDGHVLAEPFKHNDHLMDAERYVLMRLKGKVKAGISFDPDPEKNEHIIPDTREKMLADRYGELETVPRDTEREFDDDDQWKEI